MIGVLVDQVRQRSSAASILASRRALALAAAAAVAWEALGGLRRKRAFLQKLFRRQRRRRRSRRVEARGGAKAEERERERARERNKKTKNKKSICQVQLLTAEVEDTFGELAMLRASRHRGGSAYYIVALAR